MSSPPNSKDFRRFNARWRALSRTGLSIACLLVFAASCALGTRSFRVYDLISFLLVDTSQSISTPQYFKATVRSMPTDAWATSPVLSNARFFPSRRFAVKCRDGLAEFTYAAHWTGDYNKHPLVREGNEYMALRNGMGWALSYHSVLRSWIAGGALYTASEWNEDAFVMSGLGFYAGTEMDHRLGMRTFGVSIPFWLVALLSIAWPACAGVRSLRNRRRRHLSLCERCGYDLRASPQRCPECGSDGEIRKETGISTFLLSPWKRKAD